MATITGVATRVMKKTDKANGKTYCPMAIQVNGQYYNGLCFQNKKTQAFELTGELEGKQVEVAQGDTVSFDTTINGQYENIDIKTIKIISRATAPAAATTTATKPPFKSNTRQAPARDENTQLRIEIQSAQNYATQILVAMMQVEGSIPKTKLKDDKFLLGQVKMYTQQILKMRDELVIDPTGDKEFDVEIPSED